MNNKLISIYDNKIYIPELFRNVEDIGIYRINFKNSLPKILVGRGLGFDLINDGLERVIYPEYNYKNQC